MAKPPFGEGALWKLFPCLLYLSQVKIKTFSSNKTCVPLAQTLQPANPLCLVLASTLKPQGRVINTTREKF